MVKQHCAIYFILLNITDSIFGIIVYFENHFSWCHYVSHKAKSFENTRLVIITWFLLYKYLLISLILTKILQRILKDIYFSSLWELWSHHDKCWKWVHLVVKQTLSQIFHIYKYTSQYIRYHWPMNCILSEPLLVMSLHFA